MPVLWSCVSWGCVGGGGIMNGLLRTSDNLILRGWGCTLHFLFTLWIQNQFLVKHWNNWITEQIRCYIWFCLLEFGFQITESYEIQIWEKMRNTLFFGYAHKTQTLLAFGSDAQSGMKAITLSSCLDLPVSCVLGNETHMCYIYPSKNIY